MTNHAAKQPTGVRPGFIPIQPVRRVLRAYVERTHITQAQIEARTGVGARRLYPILSTGPAAVTSDTAHRITRALDREQAWHTTPLAQYANDDHISMSVLRPLVQDWIGVAQVTRSELAANAGIGRGRLTTILGGPQHTAFDTVDKLLTGLDLHDHWHTDLAQFYSPSTGTNVLLQSA